MALNNAVENDLPALPFDTWKDTLATLHMWTQVVGKVRLKSCPLVNHFWNVAFYLTARGLTSSAMPYQLGAIWGTFEVQFDFIDHQLVIRAPDSDATNQLIEACLNCHKYYRNSPPGGPFRCVSHLDPNGR